MEDRWWSQALSGPTLCDLESDIIRQHYSATSFFVVREFHGIDAISVRNAILQIQRANFKNLFAFYYVFTAKIIDNFYPLLFETKLIIHRIRYKILSKGH